MNVHRNGSRNARTSLPAVVLPYTAGGSDKVKELYGLFDDTIARLLAGLQ